MPTGFRVDVQPVPESRHKFNLLASIGEGSGGLLLAGHTDTVPYDEGRWTRDPFTLTEHDNKLYGLGTADMKGFFAFILDAVRDIDASKLTKPLYILATADEETTMAGARYFAASTAIRPDFAIIGEPTSLQPVRAQGPHGQCHSHRRPVRPFQRSGARRQRHRSDARIHRPPDGAAQNPARALQQSGVRRALSHHELRPYQRRRRANRICACCELHWISARCPA